MVVVHDARVTDAACKETLMPSFFAYRHSGRGAIKNIIKNLSKDHTVIIVAHRLSTIIDSDCIFVLNNHEIIDSGTHNELIKKCPGYKNLYEIEG